MRSKHRKLTRLQKLHILANDRRNAFLDLMGAVQRNQALAHRKEIQLALTGQSESTPLEDIEAWKENYLIAVDDQRKAKYKRFPAIPWINNIR